MKLTRGSFAGDPAPELDPDDESQQHIFVEDKGTDAAPEPAKTPFEKLVAISQSLNGESPLPVVSRPKGDLLEDDTNEGLAC